MKASLLKKHLPLLASLLGVAARDGGRLHVLDFGGAFGSTCMQHRTALAGLTECTWHIVEQEHFVAAGKAEFSTDTLHFHSTPEEAFNAAPINVILLSSVLQYLPDPYSLLKGCAERNCRSSWIALPCFRITTGSPCSMFRHPSTRRATPAAG